VRDLKQYSFAKHTLERQDISFLPPPLGVSMNGAVDLVGQTETL